MFARDYQITHDIDWFCMINGLPIHTASNGGIMPFNLCTVAELREIQQSVREIEESHDFEINRYLDIPSNPYLDGLGDNFYYFFPEALGLFSNLNLTNSQKAYYWSFVKMVKKGFYSFDRLKERNRYQLVAWPRQNNSDKGKLIHILRQVTYRCESSELDDLGKLENHGLSVNIVDIINRSSRKRGKVIEY